MARVCECIRGNCQGERITICRDSLSLCLAMEAHNPVADDIGMADEAAKQAADLAMGEADPPHSLVHAQSFGNTSRTLPLKTQAISE